MTRRHIHYCAACGDVIYTCAALPIVDDTGAHCPHEPTSGREYCPDCCVQLEFDVNDAMHDNDTTAAAQWHEGR